MLPLAFWNSPPAQSEHVSAPGASANVPGLQAVGSVLPRLHDEPSGQVVHSAWLRSPVDAPKLPPAHSVGAALPNGQNCPRLQLMGDGVPASQKKRSGQMAVHDGRDWTAASRLSPYEPA